MPFRDHVGAHVLHSEARRRRVQAIQEFLERRRDVHVVARARDDVDPRVEPRTGGVGTRQDFGGDCDVRTDGGVPDAAVEMGADRSDRFLVGVDHIAKLQLRRAKEPGDLALERVAVLRTDPVQPGLLLIGPAVRLGVEAGENRADLIIPASTRLSGVLEDRPEVDTRLLGDRLHHALLCFDPFGCGTVPKLPESSDDVTWGRTSDRSSSTISACPLAARSWSWSRVIRLPPNCRGDRDIDAASVGCEQKRYSSGHAGER